MRRFILGLAIALLTFTVGTLVTLLWVVPHFKPTLNNSGRQDSTSAPPPLKLQCADTGKPAQKEVEANLSQAHSSSWRISAAKVSGGENLYVVQFLNASEGWLAGENGALYKTVDAGSRWQKIKLDVPDGSDIAGVSFVSSSLGWIVVEKHGDVLEPEDNEIWIMNTTDAGQSWQVQYQGNGFWAHRIVFLNDHEGWLGGGHQFKTDYIHQELLVLHTTDQGKHWTDASSELNRNADANSSATNIYPVSPGNALVLDFGHNLFSTDDGGKSWKKILSFPEEPPQSYMSRFDFIGDRRLWAVGGADSIEGMWGTLAHMDADCSWTLYTKGGIWLTDAAFLSEQDVLACGAIPSPGNEMPRAGRDALIVESHDLGANWEVVYRNARVKEVNAITKTDTNNIWAVGSNGYVLHLQR